MTPRLRKLITVVVDFYNSSASVNQAPNKWLLDNHVKIVAHYAKKVSQKGNSCRSGKGC